MARQAGGTGCAVFPRSEFSQSAYQGTAGIPRKLSGESLALAFRAKELLIELAEISLEIAQMAITPEDGTDLPNWFVVEAAKDIPVF